VFLLALPDFLGYPDAIAMADKYGTEVTKGLMMKKVANYIQAMVGGREIHQENAVVGGFGKIPTREEMDKAYRQLEEIRDTAKVAIDILASLQMPKYLDGEYNHVALKQTDEFDAFGEVVASTSGVEFPVEEYREYLIEKPVSHSFAKFAYLEGKEFMVGALSRLALNGDTLWGESLKIYKELVESGKLRFNNAFYNNLSQAIELLYFVDASLEVLRKLLDMPLDNDRIEVKPKAGRGVAITEAPRGIISYTVEYDDDGNVVFADLVTPTAYNFNIMHRDTQKMAEGVLLENPDIDDDELVKYLEMVPRAYDPCISCSVHLIREE
jgi:sulfhydrogenase subunit alpha